MNKTATLISIVIFGLSSCFLFGQDFLCYDRNQIETQINEMRKKYAGPEYSAVASSEAFKNVILFLQNPTKYFGAIKNIPHVQSYISLYGTYLNETHKLNGLLIGVFLDKHFSTIDEERVPILTFLLLNCSQGVFGELTTWYYIDLFASNPQLFIQDLKKRSGWREVVDNLVPFDSGKFKESMKKLGASDFEKQFKNYVSSRYEFYEKRFDALS